MMKIRNFGNFCILVLAANCFLVCSGASVNGTDSNSTQIQMLNGSTTTSSSVASNSNKSSDDSQEINLAEIMQKCNETAKVTTEYLKELNDTGSFPDEADKTPMCYIKCYLEKIGILSADGQVNKNKAIDMLWAQSEETLEECSKEMTGDPCERAYYLARCVMTRSLVEKNSQIEK